jgi:hypothetical protein
VFVWSEQGAVRRRKRKGHLLLLKEGKGCWRPKKGICRMEWCRRAGVHRGGQRFFIRAVDGRVQAEETDHEKLVGCIRGELVPAG